MSFFPRAALLLELMRQIHRPELYGQAASRCHPVRTAPPTVEPFIVRSSLTSRAHCFHRSTFRSSLYIVQDFIVIGASMYCAYHIDPFLQQLSVLPMIASDSLTS